MHAHPGFPAFSYITQFDIINRMKRAIKNINKNVNKEDSTVKLSEYILNL